MDERTRQAHAEAKKRSRLMLHPEACSKTVAAEEDARLRVYRDDSYAEPKRQEPKPEPAQRRTTDAESLRTEQWQRYIDARIAEHVEQALSQHRAASIAWIKASAKAITRDHTEIEKLDLRLSALLQSVEKMQRGFGDDAKVIDLPAFVGKRDVGR